MSSATTYSHRLEHLGSADDRLARQVAFGDHHLLGDEDLSARDFNTQVTASNHDTVCDLQDLVKVLDALVVLDLADDPDVLSFHAQHLADLTDIICATNKRCKDHIDIVLDAKQQVLLVLL